jgi:hypothetical protein
MSERVNNAIRLGLSLSMLNKDSFAENVSMLLEKYQNNPEKLEKIAAGLYQYLEDVRDRMDTKSKLTNVVKNINVPTNNEINELTKAIHKLSEVIATKD